MNAKIPGINLLHKMRPGDEWITNPFGPGIIIANPEYPPLWVRIENDKIEKDEILGNWTDFPRQFAKWKAAQDQAASPGKTHREEM